MKRAVATGLLSLAVAAFGEAQTLPSSPSTVAGRELLAAGDPLEAAGAFHRALLDAAPGGFSLRVAVYCDLSNLEQHVRTSGNPEELLRAPPVGRRPAVPGALLGPLPVPGRGARRPSLGPRAAAHARPVASGGRRDPASGRAAPAAGGRGSLAGTLGRAGGRRAFARRRARPRGAGASSRPRRRGGRLAAAGRQRRAAPPDAGAGGRRGARPGHGGHRGLLCPLGRRVLPG